MRAVPDVTDVAVQLYTPRDVDELLLDLLDRVGETACDGTVAVGSRGAVFEDVEMRRIDLLDVRPVEGVAPRCAALLLRLGVVLARPSIIPDADISQRVEGDITNIRM